MKEYFTKEQLIQKAIEYNKAHENDPDLEQIALGGYIETHRGFVWYSDYSLDDDET